MHVDTTRTIIMMNRGGENSDSIPMDLILEILSRLPLKSITRFRCVSKLWESIICRQDFTKLFHIMSLSNPRLLIVVRQVHEWSIFSSPQPRNHYGKSSSLVVSANFHTKLSRDISVGGSQNSPPISYASGLFYFPNIRISKEYDNEVRVICDPSTGQSAILPLDHQRPLYIRRRGLLGFDPIAKQFKVLVLYGPVHDGTLYHILTLGTKKVRWRKIKCPLIYFLDSGGICINGVLYYFASSFHNEEKDKILGFFDVRSEKFNFLHVEPDVLDCFQKLIDYKGKLCGCNLEYGNTGGLVKLRMWVLEDVEKGEWSPYAYTLSFENTVREVNYYIYVVGMTASGEIVLAKRIANKQFYVFFFNPGTNTLQSIEIQLGFGEEEWSRCYGVYCFVDYVQDLNFDVMKKNHMLQKYLYVRPPVKTREQVGRRSTFESRALTNLMCQKLSLFDAICICFHLAYCKVFGYNLLFNSHAKTDF